MVHYERYVCHSERSQLSGDDFFTPPLLVDVHDV